MYIWVPARWVFPNTLKHWQNSEYRHPGPRTSVTSLWMVHPQSCRCYNAFHDVWDLWIPADFKFAAQTVTSDPTRPPQNVLSLLPLQPTHASPQSPSTPSPLHEYNEPLGLNDQPDPMSLLDTPIGNLLFEDTEFLIPSPQNRVV